MKKRISKIRRKTLETDISINLNLDGKGKLIGTSGIGFFDHMLKSFVKNSLIDLKLNVKGDLIVDEHHTVEDIGIVLGQTLKKALGDKMYIERYGFVLPMEESLAEAVIDLSGRSYLVWNVKFKREKIGDMPTELFEDFFKAIADNLGANIHINLRYGRNEHHIAEAIFKAFGRAMKAAIARDKRNLLPTIKGKL